MFPKSSQKIFFNIYLLLSRALRDCFLLFLDIFLYRCMSLWFIRDVFFPFLPMGTVPFLMLFSKTPTGDYPLLLFSLMRSLPTLTILHIWGDNLTFHFLQQHLQLIIPLNQFLLFTGEISKFVLQIFSSSSRSLSLTSKSMKVHFLWGNVPTLHCWWTWSILYSTMP